MRVIIGLTRWVLSYLLAALAVVVAMTVVVIVFGVFVHGGGGPASPNLEAFSLFFRYLYLGVVVMAFAPVFLLFGVAAMLGVRLGYVESAIRGVIAGLVSTLALVWLASDKSGFDISLFVDAAPTIAYFAALGVVGGVALTFLWRNMLR